MTLQGSQRRDMRRRMMQSGTAAQPADDAAPARANRSTPYAAAARPENHPAIATLLPSRPLRLLAACLGIATLVAVVAAVGGTVHALLPAATADHGQSWARSARAAKDLLSIFSRTGLPAWLGQMLLIASACVAVSVRQMRRHRLDDYQGRYRAWGWIAVLAVVAAAERQMPLSAVLSAGLTDATGIVLGPEGLGWWLAVSGIVCLGVGLWAVLPLSERLGTSLGLSLVATAWIASSGCDWFGGGTMPVALAARCLGLAGDGLLLVTMLVAARAVLREVRGETAGRTPNRGGRPAEPRKPVKEEAKGPEHASAVVPHPAVAVSSHQWSDGNDAEDESDDDWSESDGRKLSKAEKKRLRRMARMNRAA